jgi:hypothetical protein
MAADPILTDLQYVMETGQELDILNFHKGFPITCKARVDSITPSGVTLKVQPPGSVCLEKQEQTILLSRGLPEAVRARVIEFHLQSGRLVLADFGYVSSNFGERMIARVQPEGVVKVEIHNNDQSCDGDLIDVSLKGVGILIQKQPFEIGQLIKITLPLPEGRVTLPGKILNINMIGEKQRLSVGFTRNAQEIAVIMRYIKDRKTEILAEIDRMYQESLKQPRYESK